MNYYPEGMSYDDLVHVGEIADPYDPPAKFLDLFSAEFDGKAYELWEEYCDSDTDLSPKWWVEKNYPEMLAA